MEEELLYSSEKKTVIDKISHLNQSDREQLFKMIKIAREKRLCSILNALKEEEKTILESSFHKKQVKKHDRAFKYSPTKILQPHVPIRMEQCFHYIFFVQDQQAEQKEEHTCSICVKEFEQNEKVTELSCKHYFHTECIESWFNTRVNCPNCRQQPSSLIDPKMKEITELRDKGLKIVKRNNLMLEKMEIILKTTKKDLY